MYWPSTSQNNFIEHDYTTDADYFFKNVTIKRFDSDGNIINQLKSKKIEHFNHTKISNIISPEIQITDVQVTDTQNDIWNISAKNGELNHQTNKIEMNDSVKISELKQDTNEQQSNMLITTEQLTFDLTNNTANTPEQVLLTTQETTTTAQAMFLDIKNKQIEFSGKTQTEGLINAIK